MSDMTPELTPHDPPDRLATSEQAALLPRPGSLGDAFLALLVLIAVLGAGFIVAGGGGRAVELLVAIAAVAVAYLASRRAGLPVAIVGIVAYLALEWHYGRLDGGHYWQEAIFAVAIGLAVLAAVHIRLTSEERRIGLLDARAALEARDAAGAGLGPRGLPPLEFELERARRHNHQLSLLVLRADNADDIEVRFGDDGLRVVLERITQTLARSLRATDVVLRDGRVDHWVILPQAAPLDGRAGAERVRLAVAAERIEFGPGELVDLSVSIGVASFPDDGTTYDDIVSAARLAFEHALELGGNRSVLHSAAGATPRGWALTGEPSH